MDANKPGVDRLFAMFVVTALFFGGDHPAEAKGVTLVVAVDRDAYITNEMGLLAEQVRAAANSEPSKADIGTTPDGVRAVVYDLGRDSQYVDAIEKYATGKPGFTIRKTPSRSIRISFSREALAAHNRAWISRESGRLEALVKDLRTLPRSVRVEPKPYGAIVRSDDPAFGARMISELGAILLISPIDHGSWRVELNPKALSYLSPTAALTERRSIELLLREFLGEPDVISNLTGQGIVVTLADRDKKFIDVVARAFEGNSDFVVTVSPAMVLQIAIAGATSTDKFGRPSDAVLRTLGDLQDITHPSVGVTVKGDAVLCRATDAAHSADRAAVVRQAFAGRNDLVIVTQPDSSLLIKLKPGAHLGSPVRPLKDGDLEAAVRARAKALHISIDRVTTVDDHHVRAEFATDADAAAFRSNLSDRFGFSIRLADDSDEKDSGKMPPSPDDLQMPNAKGGFIWVKPAAIITGSMITDAKVVDDHATGSPAVEFHLNGEGRDRFAEATLANVGRRLAIIVNGSVWTAPIVESPIEGGTGEIICGCSRDEAEDMARTLLTYKEDIPLKIVEQVQPN